MISKDKMFNGCAGLFMIILLQGCSEPHPEEKEDFYGEYYVSKTVSDVQGTMEFEDMETRKSFDKPDKPHLIVQEDSFSFQWQDHKFGSDRPVYHVTVGESPNGEGGKIRFAQLQVSSLSTKGEWDSPKVIHWEAGSTNSFATQLPPYQNTAIYVVLEKM